MKKPHLDFIKELKNTLHIPLQKAMALAHQHGENIEKCRNALYQEQISLIVEATSCDIQEAKTLFDIHQDTQKVIEKLQNKTQYLTIANRPITEKYGFSLWAEDENEQLCQGKSAVIFIPFSHFELLLDDFNAVFPLKNGIFAPQNRFDITGTNVFDTQSIIKIVEKILSHSWQDKNEAEFVQQLTHWLLEKSQQAKHIMVFGNM